MHNSPRWQRQEFTQSALVILPFYPGARDPDMATQMLFETIGRLVRIWPNITVVDDGAGIVPEGENYELLSMPQNRGKISAVREGIRSRLADDSIQFFSAVDFDDEQDQDDLVSLLDLLVHQEADAVVADRYAYFEAGKVLRHRRLANTLNLLLSRALGFEATDLAAAMVACNRTFAAHFVRQSSSTKEGLGFDWLPLCFLGGFRLVNAPIHAKMRSTSTNGDKLARNYAILLNYQEELVEAGAGRIVEFCQAYFNGLKERRDVILLPVGLLDAYGELVLVRQDDGISYSYDGWVSAR